MNRKGILFAVAALLITSCLLGGCRQQNTTVNIPSITTPTTTTEEQTTMTTAVVPPFYQADEEVFLTETPYAILQYPVEWQDDVNIFHQEGEVYTVKFSAKLSSGEVPLFDLIFGKSEEYCLGTLPVDGGKLPVHIRNYEVNSEEMPREEYIQWCGMCDGVNVIISGLVYNHGMELET